MATALKVKEIHSGVIHKVGGRVKSWNKRWMVLSSDYMLHYYKDASKASLGSISINDPAFSIRKGEPNDIAWPKQCRIDNSLVITTTGRTYFMFAESISDFNGWMTAITSVQELVRAKTSSSTLPDRYNKMGGRAANLSAPNALPSEPRKTPKQYKKKDRRLPTKRFNSVSTEYDSGPDSDDNNEGGNDGQLLRDVRSSLPTISHSIEGVYDLVSSVDNNNDTPVSPTSSLSATLAPPPPGGRGRNSSEVSLESTSNLQSSICVNESLYDLVGRINAGEEIETTTTTEGQQQQELYEPINEPQQELYEPIENSDTSSPPNLPISSSKLPPPPPPPYTATGQQEELYELVPEPHPNSNDVTMTTGVMYEDIERSSDLKEADSSDEEDTVPLPNSLLPPPPLPPRVGEEMYDNAPALPPKGPPVTIIEETDDSYYGNVGNSPSSRRPLSSPTPVRHNELKSPKPLPRSKITNQSNNLPPSPTTNTTNTTSNIDNNDIDSNDKLNTSHHNDNELEQELYDDIQVVLERHVNEEEEEEKGKEEEEKEMNGLNVKEEEEEGRDVVVDITSLDESNTTSQNNNDATESTLLILRKPNNDHSGKRRVHSATVGAGDAGIEMFYRKAKELTCDTDESSIRKHVRDLFLAEQKQAIMSSEDKVVLAETLREIETEKQLASEEKFRWERERLKFEEERKQFEREKQKLLEELARTKAELETKQ